MKTSEAKRAQVKEYKRLNRSKVNGWAKRRYHDNLDGARTYYRNRCRTARQDPNRRLVDALRARLKHALQGQLRIQSTLKLLGCSTQELRQHLESNFQLGMTWENYGEWHVDHIRPCASFDLTDPKQQAECFHYTNLQPLWAFDNKSKGSRT